ncbi:MAG TPA: LPS assembly lipoprotein LptE [Thermoanaerobaculales bacterium]|mgnify:CR=1 FL=1|nr:LPS assembly lipoprotein LptE [Thermoanaerobaculales bacterium]
MAGGACYRGALMASPMRTLIVAALGLALAGCGYHLVGTANTLPEGVSTLYVERFQNQTRYVDMDQRIDEALSLEWVRRRRLQLVDDRASSDLVLSGVILNLGLAPVRFDEQGRATEYQMSLTTSVKLFDIRGSEPKLLWEDLAFSRRNSYEVDPNAADYFDRQVLAMDQLADDYSAALVSAVLEGF